jgi:hypothetical protein
MTAKELAIGIAVGVFLYLVLIAVGAIYFSRKSPEERRQVSKKIQNRMDKAQEGTDDLNEPARWVP